MATQIELLAGLQDVDRTLHENTRAVEDARTRVARLDANLAEKTAAFDAAERTLGELEARQRDLEGRLADIEERLKDRRMRVARIRNERELGVLRHEIDLLKEEAGTHETELLGLFEQLDAVRATRDTARSARDAVATERDDAAAALADTVGRVADAIAADQARRDELVKSVAADLCRQYELIFARRGGLAVVEVRDGICLGCHMKVPPQLYNRILRNDEERPLQCPSCQRLLHCPIVTEGEPS